MRVLDSQAGAVRFTAKTKPEVKFYTRILKNARPVGTPGLGVQDYVREPKNEKGEIVVYPALQALGATTRIVYGQDGSVSTLTQVISPGMVPYRQRVLPPGSISRSLLM